MEEIKISLLIPVFNVQNYIERCAGSLFCQDYGNLEFIFVNDCTPDRSIEIIKETLIRYPHRKEQVKILANEYNLGLGGTRRKALLAASGEYVMWIDGDDWLEDNKVISEFAKKAVTENADLVIADHYYSNSKIKIPHPVHFENKKQYLYDTLSHKPGCSVSVWNKLIKRELHLKFIPIVGLNFGEDYAFLPRLVAESNHVVHIPVYSYNYWQDNPNSYVRNFSEQSFYELIKATEILCDFFHDSLFGISDETLKIARVRTKIFLLQRARGKLRKKAAKLWPEDNISNEIRGNERIIFLLAKLNLLFVYDWIFSIYKSLKPWIGKANGH